MQALQITCFSNRLSPLAMHVGVQEMSRLPLDFPKHQAQLSHDQTAQSSCCEFCTDLDLQLIYS